MCKSKYLELSMQARRWAQACWDKSLRDSYEDLAKAYEHMAQSLDQLTEPSDCADLCESKLIAE